MQICLITQLYLTPGPVLHGSLHPLIASGLTTTLNHYAGLKHGKTLI